MPQVWVAQRVVQGKASARFFLEALAGAKKSHQEGVAQLPRLAAALGSACEARVPAKPTQLLKTAHSRVQAALQAKEAAAGEVARLEAKLEALHNQMREQLEALELA